MARKGGRIILNGIFYILRTGAPLRDFPGRYGLLAILCNRYARRGEYGV